MKTRIKIIGGHQWTGLTGIVIDDRRAGQRIPSYVRVQLEDGQDCPHQLKCLVHVNCIQILRPRQRNLFETGRRPTSKRFDHGRNLFGRRDRPVSG